jgi:hypothetical protein
MRTFFDSFLFERASALFLPIDFHRLALFRYIVHIPDVCRKEFNQLSVNFINDRYHHFIATPSFLSDRLPQVPSRPRPLSSFFNSYRTALCIEQPPSVIASGALFLAALQLGIRPVNPNPRSTVELTWFALLETDIEFDVLQSKLT